MCPSRARGRGWRGGEGGVGNGGPRTASEIHSPDADGSCMVCPLVAEQHCRPSGSPFNAVLLTPILATGACERVE